MKLSLILFFLFFYILFGVIDILRGKRTENRIKRVVYSLIISLILSLSLYYRPTNSDKDVDLNPLNTKEIIIGEWQNNNYKLSFKTDKTFEIKKTDNNSIMQGNWSSNNYNILFVSNDKIPFNYLRHVTVKNIDCLINGRVDNTLEEWVIIYEFRKVK